MKRLAVILLALILVWLGCSTSLNAAELRDTQHDTAQQFDDIAVLRVSNAEHSQIIEIIYAAPLPQPLYRHVVVFIDADGNEQTGGPGGAELRIVVLHMSFDIGPVATADLVYPDNQKVPIGAYGTTWAHSYDGYRFEISSAATGIPMNNARVFVNSIHDESGMIGLNQPAAGMLGYDRAPDIGYLDPTRGEVVLPFPGNRRCAFTLTDPNPSQGMPDIIAARGAMRNGNLYILLDFNHPMSPGQLQEDLLITIDMDLDKSLATGFTSMGFDPPSFGVDARIELTVGVLTPPQGKLLFLSPATKAEGAQFDAFLPREEPCGSISNDTLVVVGQNPVIGTQDNQLLCVMPLSLLGFPNGNMFMQMKAMAARVGPQSSDMLPPTTALGITTRRKRPFTRLTLAPPLAPQGRAFRRADRIGDAEWLAGRDGNDITAITAARLNNGGLMFRVWMAMLEIEDASYVYLGLDLDGNIATGIPYPGGLEPTLGAEIILGLHPRRPFLQWEQNGEVVMRDAAHLAHIQLGMQGGYYTVSIPPELLTDMGELIRFAASAYSFRFGFQEPFPVPEGGEYSDFAPDQAAHAWRPLGTRR